MLNIRKKFTVHIHIIYIYGNFVPPLLANLLTLTTMAIVENFWLKDQRKKLAGAVIYQAMGQTRSRKLAETVSNPRTTTQMNQRVRWSNLVNLYRANRSWMKYAFENKSQSQTDYNKFMSLNVASSRIYLTKQQAAAGACVLDEYVFTQGSLPSIEVLRASGNWQTNIILPDGYEFSQLTTVGELSQALIAYNPAIREGDQISFVKMTQNSNAVNGAPYVIVREYEMLVKSNSAALVKDYLPLDYIDSSESDSDCRLIIRDSGLAGGFLLILSRTVAGKTYVSSQRLVLANMSAYLNAFSSQAQLQASIESYGENEEPFLSSIVAVQDRQAPSALSIMGVGIGGNSFVTGQQSPSISIANDDEVVITLNGAAGTSVSNIRIYGVNSSGNVQANVTFDETEEYLVEGKVSGLAAPLTGVTVTKVSFLMDGIVYQAIFPITNESTIQGLE